MLLNILCVLRLRIVPDGGASGRDLLSEREQELCLGFLL